MSAPPADLLIEGALVLTPGEEPLSAGRIVIRGPLIEAVGPAMGPPPPAVRLIDGRGMIAMPGLINVHTHAVLCLMRGVAEDMGFAPAYTRGVPRAPMIAPHEAAALARLGAAEALRLGSTLICDTYVHAAQTLPAMAEIGLRINGCTLLHDVDFAGMPDGRWEYDDAIGDARLAETVDLAERLHGSYEGRLRIQMAPHAPDTCSTAFLARCADAAGRLGLRTATHLAQSPIEVARVRARDGCSPVELLDRLGLLDERLVAAHCICMDEADIALAGRAGIHVAHVPRGNAGGGMMAPTLALRAAGARLALATDNLLADMLEAQRWALCIGRLQSGRVAPDWQPEDVFAMATSAGAEAMGMAGQIGRLAPGARADVVLLDARGPQFAPMLDPLGVLVHCAQGEGVRHVLVDGRQVLRDGRLLTCNIETVRAEAQAAAESLWARAVA